MSFFEEEEEPGMIPAVKSSFDEGFEDPGGMEAPPGPGDPVTAGDDVFRSSGGFEDPGGFEEPGQIQESRGMENQDIPVEDIIGDEEELVEIGEEHLEEEVLEDEEVYEEEYADELEEEVVEDSQAEEEVVEEEEEVIEEVEDEQDRVLSRPKDSFDEAFESAAYSEDEYDVVEEIALGQEEEEEEEEEEEIVLEASENEEVVEEEVELFDPFDTKQTEPEAVYEPEAALSVPKTAERPISSDIENQYESYSPDKTSPAGYTPMGDASPAGYAFMGDDEPANNPSDPFPFDAAPAGELPKYGAKEDTRSQMTEDEGKQKWCIVYLLCALLFCGAVVGIVLGVVLGLDNSEEAQTRSIITDPPAPSPTPSPTTGVQRTTEMDAYVPGDCDFSDQVQPHVLAQCACTGEIGIIAADIEQNYLQLEASLIPLLFEAFTEPMNSCAPANQALVWLASGNNSANGVLLQKFVLAFVFFRLGGPSWVRRGNWITEAGECLWDGVSCDAEGTVTGINLDGNNLSGQLLGEIGKLLSLTSFSVASNSLSGELPLPLFSATSMREIDISGNDITGPIPTEIAQLADLETLRLNSNSMAGEIISELGLLVNLKELDLGGNAFTGMPPTELVNLAALTSLALNDNTLTGQLPAFVSNLTSLEYLDFSDNNFLSFIPRQYGTLTALKVYLLNRAGVTGVFPTEMGSMVSLERLEVADNRVRGEIPVNIASLPSLSTLILSDNDMEGTIPTEIGLAVDLTVLALHQNEFTGTVPAELSNLKKLESLTLEGNLLSGRVPDEVCALTMGEGVLTAFRTDCPNRVTDTGGVICECCTECLAPPMA